MAKKANLDLALITLIELLEYTQKHPREEEQIMQRDGYKHYVAQMKSHIFLVKRTEELIEEVKVGSLVLIPYLTAHLFCRKKTKGYIQSVTLFSFNTFSSCSLSLYLFTID